MGRQGSEESCPAGWCRRGSRGFTCQGCWESVEELVSHVPRAHPDVLVVDGGLSQSARLSCLVLLRAVVPSVPILITSGQEDPREIVCALRAGAMGYLLEPVSRRELETSIRRLIAGQVVLSRRAVSCLVKTLRAPGPAPEWTRLSAKERQVLALEALGLFNKEIGSKIGMKDGTVHTHLHRAFEKLRVRNKRGALRKFPWLRLSRSLKLPPSPAVGPAEPGKNPENLRQLRQRFHTENSCRRYLFELRWPDGFECPNCGGGRAWETARGLWLCQACQSQCSVTAGTVFQGTRMPLPVWFRAAWELTDPERSANALKLLRECRLGSYKTAWGCLHKLRRCLQRVTAQGAPTSSVTRGQLFRKLLQTALNLPFRPPERASRRRACHVKPTG
jgi:DNA-binding NarL/FixJ family response regulator